VKLFALIDHSGEAEKVGLKMPPTKLLILGNPKAGTPLMLASPSVAIDLPLTGFPTNGMFFCSIMIARTENGRQRKDTPLASSTDFNRITVRYE
jgi:hypothetical protein